MCAFSPVVGKPFHFVHAIPGLNVARPPQQHPRSGYQRHPKFQFTRPEKERPEMAYAVKKQVHIGRSSAFGCGNSLKSRKPPDSLLPWDRRIDNSQLSRGIRRLYLHYYCNICSRPDSGFCSLFVSPIDKIPKLSLQPRDSVVIQIPNILVLRARSRESVSQALNGGP